MGTELPSPPFQTKASAFADFAAQAPWRLGNQAPKAAHEVPTQSVQQQLQNEQLFFGRQQLMQRLQAKGIYEQNVTTGYPLPGQQKAPELPAIGYPAPFQWRALERPHCMPSQLSLAVQETSPAAHHKRTGFTCHQPHLNVRVGRWDPSMARSFAVKGCPRPNRQEASCQRTVEVGCHAPPAWEPGHAPQILPQGLSNQIHRPKCRRVQPAVLGSPKSGGMQLFPGFRPPDVRAPTPPSSSLKEVVRTATAQNLSCSLGQTVPLGLESSQSGQKKPGFQVRSNALSEEQRPAVLQQQQTATESLQIQYAWPAPLDIRADASCAAPAERRGESPSLPEAVLSPGVSDGLGQRFDWAAASRLSVERTGQPLQAASAQEEKAEEPLAPQPRKRQRLQLSEQVADCKPQPTAATEPANKKQAPITTAPAIEPMLAGSEPEGNRLPNASLQPADELQPAAEIYLPAWGSSRLRKRPKGQRPNTKLAASRAFEPLSPSLSAQQAALEEEAADGEGRQSASPTISSTCCGSARRTASPSPSISSIEGGSLDAQDDAATAAGPKLLNLLTSSADSFALDDGPSGFGREPCNPAADRAARIEMRPEVTVLKAELSQAIQDEGDSNESAHLSAEMLESGAVGIPDWIIDHLAEAAEAQFQPSHSTSSDRDAASEAFSDGNRSELESAAEKPPSAQQSDVPEIAVPRQSVRLAGKRHKQQRISLPEACLDNVEPEPEPASEQHQAVQDNVNPRQSSRRTGKSCQQQEEETDDAEPRLTAAVRSAREIVLEREERASENAAAATRRAERLLKRQALTEAVLQKVSHCSRLLEKRRSARLNTEPASDGEAAQLMDLVPTPADEARPMETPQETMTVEPVDEDVAIAVMLAAGVRVTKAKLAWLRAQNKEAAAAAAARGLPAKGLEPAALLQQAAEAIAGVPTPCSEHNLLLRILTRPKRIPGGNPLDHPAFQRFIGMIRGNSRRFEADGRILRLKQYMMSDANCATMDAVIDALAHNTRVEALYIQNFEAGMRNEQLEHLMEVLKRGRIWALNIGENFHISLDGWQRFTDQLPETAVSYLYVSEHHLLRTDLKVQMRDAIRENRRRLPPLDVAVTSRITNMWWNPPKRRLHE